jgi:hypothetical protein
MLQLNCSELRIHQIPRQNSMARFLIVFIALMVSIHTTMGGIGKHCFLCYFSAILQKSSCLYMVEICTNYQKIILKLFVLSISLTWKDYWYLHTHGWVNNSSEIRNIRKFDWILELFRQRGIVFSIFVCKMYIVIATNPLQYMVNMWCNG